MYVSVDGVGIPWPVGLDKRYGLKIWKLFREPLHVPSYLPPECSETGRMI